VVFQSGTQILPNPGRIRPSPAKENQRKSLGFLRRIEPFQWVMPTPMALFSFLAASGLKIMTAAYNALARPDWRSAPRCTLTVDPCGHGKIGYATNFRFRKAIVWTTGKSNRASEPTRLAFQLRVARHGGPARADRSRPPQRFCA
jgi:hypothetical protein